MAQNEGGPRILLGTQGFSFDDWVGRFYPAGTPKHAFLEQYARRFPSVEIDSTFYATPRASVVSGWRERTPEEFVFAAKFPRLITHDKKLDRALGDAEHFVDTMKLLDDKLGPLILQFAYDFKPELFDRLDRFLAQLPSGPRYAVELRNRDWLTDELRAMLSGHNVALVLQDLHYMPRLDWVTADFVLIRWLGRRADIEEFDRLQIDRSELLQEWVERAQGFIDAGLDLYGYFNNHFAGHSPASVRQFAELLGLELPPAGGGPAPDQLTLDLD